MADRATLCSILLCHYAITSIFFIRQLDETRDLCFKRLIEQNLAYMNKNMKKKQKKKVKDLILSFDRYGPLYGII